MTKVLTNEQNYYDIADTIRQMKNVNTTYKPRQMASALKDIYSNEVEGVPPLSFEANGNNLLNYRIDGASGGVGDRTGNLFDGSWENKFIDTYGNTGYSTNRVLSSYVTVIPNQTYSVKSNMHIRSVHSYNDTTHTQTLIDSVSGLDGATFTIPADSNSIRISLKKANDGVFTPNDIDWFMLNAGSTALPYEPYGYKVPVVVSGKNLFDENSELNTNSTMDLTTGTFPGSTGDNKRTFFFKAKPNTTYTFSCDTIGDRLVICEYNRIINPSDYSTSHKITPNIKTFSQASGISEYSFTTSSTTKMVGIYYSLNTLPTNIQIEIGNIATDYEPYIEETTNIYLDNPIRTINDEIEYIDYSEQKQHRVRKNLLQNTATTQTINGVNVIVNNDGSIKLSGTSTAITYIDINSNFNSTEFQDCYLNPFYPNNFVSSASTVLLRISNTTNRNSIQDFLNNSVIRDNGSNLRLAIRIGQNYTFSNDFVISPMISKFSDNTYEPYIENTEVDVTLPAIPTLDGTNTLSIDTTVQPSNMYIQAPKDSIEATQIANELEEI